MKKLLLWVRSRPMLVRKATMFLALIGATVAAFYWGRSTLDAQQVQPRTLPTIQPAQPSTDYARRVVAYIYENTPISREELGEYLIARFGQERIEFLVNRRIVELDCQAKGVYVTDLEVEAQLQEEL